MSTMVPIVKSMDATALADGQAQNNNDPAYVQVVKDIVYLHALNVILTSGGGGGVDWEKAKSGIYAVNGMLGNSKVWFDAVASKELPSQTYTAVLASTIAVSNPSTFVQISF